MLLAACSHRCSAANCLLNVPLAGLALVLAFALIALRHGQTTGFDLPGALSATAWVTLLRSALVEGPTARLALAGYSYQCSIKPAPLAHSFQGHRAQKPVPCRRDCSPIVSAPPS